MIAYVTLTGCQHYLGVDDLAVGETVILNRDPKNEHDPNAIAVTDLEHQYLGYVANQDYTALCGTMLADDLAEEDFDSYGRIEVIFSNCCICKINIR